eukprot:CAMPEP_0170640642 /NCGR_PEP_ID=MMETSP0224-20130122/40338_1 /TAXON_ID=285029 /ORGANISM="Togula jolla, Strain CCCM 725" /LENGTH=67 /DNA_ID=CAMNT_0010971171 /DNA_START=25 /DNA_END=225 /DNA_ORIENTATION=-
MTNWSSEVWPQLPLDFCDGDDCFSTVLQIHAKKTPQLPAARLAPLLGALMHTRFLYYGAAGGVVLLA